MRTAASDRAVARIAGKFDKQPEVEAAVRQILAETYFDAGQYPAARSQLEKALELQRRALGPENPKTINTMRSLGTMAFRQKNYREAEALLNQTLQISRKVLGPEHRDTLACMYGLAVVYHLQHKDTQADALRTQTLEIQNRVLGPEDPDTLVSINFLANVYEQQGKYPQAEALHNQNLEIRRRLLGPEHPDTVRSMNNLANVYEDQRDYPKAEELLTQVLEIRRRVLGPEHPDTRISMDNLAGLDNLEGKYAQATTLYSKVLEIRRRVLGAEDPQTLLSTSNLANNYKEQGKYALAEALFRKTLQDNPKNPAPLEALAWYLVVVPDRRLRRPQEALDLSRRAAIERPEVPSYRSTLGLAEYRNDHWDEAIASLNRAVELSVGSNPLDFFFLAMAHRRRGDRGEAEHSFDRGVEGASKEAANHPEWRMFWAEAAEVLGKPGPVPTLLEAQAEPQRVMETLKRAAAAGQLKAETLQISPDLAPLRGRADFQALIRSLR